MTRPPRSPRRGRAPALPGSPFPLGATVARRRARTSRWRPSVADGMLLCLFDDGGAETQIPLLDYDAGVWHGFVPGRRRRARPTGTGSAGPYDPAAGLRCNPAKLLLDPYARAISGDGHVRARGARLRRGRPGRAERRSTRPAHVPRSLVVDAGVRLARRRPAAGTRYADTIIYEVHVKGFTMRHPDVPARAARHLRRAGPRGGHRAPASTSASPPSSCCRCTRTCPRRSWSQRGLTNYWGYNTIGFFAPHDGYSAAVRAGRPGGQVAEFKAMVDALHAAGLEVILDVVFNHTAEGGPDGPDAVLPRPRQPGLLPARPGDPRPLRRHDRLRQLAERRRPDRRCG